MTASSLRSFQEALLHDLYAQGGTPMRMPAMSEQPGFSVYRNTVQHGCIDALAANYPTVQQLVGSECFADLAAEFVRGSPPERGTLADYGTPFIAFLGAHAAVAELGYLPSIARLDRLWTETHLAAEAPALRTADFAALDPERLSMARFVPHPAARWTVCEGAPAYTIWQRHREQLPLDAPIEWHGESALLTRPASVVEWRAIPAGAVAFLGASRDGLPFDDAIRCADAASSGDDVSWLASLIEAGAFTRLDLAGQTP